jgi:hypothetical protein
MMTYKGELFLPFALALWLTRERDFSNSKIEREIRKV